MNTQLQILLVLLCASLALAFTSGSDFSKDEKKRFDDCKPLAKPDKNSKSSASSQSSESMEMSGSGSGSGESSGSGSGSGSVSSESSEASGGSSESGEWEHHEYSFLFKIFMQFSLTLDVSIRDTFVLWINKTQMEVVEMPGLTEYEVLVEVWYSLKTLFEANVEIKKKIEFMFIGDWGYVCDLEGLAITIQTATPDVTVQESITIITFNDSSPLLEALEEAEMNATAGDTIKIKTLKDKIKVIIKSGYSYAESLVLIYKEFKMFYDQYPNLKEWIASFKIKGFGKIKSFYDISRVYWRIKNFSLVVGGASSNTLLLKGLVKIYEDTTLDVSVRSDFKQYHDKLKLYFDSETNVKLRAKFAIDEGYQFLILTKWNINLLYSIQLEGFGSLYDFIFAYSYSITNGIVDADFTTVGTTMSTTMASTTPFTPGMCSNANSVNVQISNSTLMLQAIDAAQSSVPWTNSEKNSFLGYKKRIYNIAYNASAGWTANIRFNEIKVVLNGYVTAFSANRALLFGVNIPSWGTIEQYCGCSNK